jgi:transposase
VAGELILSFVPDPEQRLWRTLTRSKQQLMRDRVRLHSQLESLLEDARIKLATVVTDLLGVSSRRMLEALADGAMDPTALAAMAEPELRATPEQLIDVLHAAATMTALHRKILRLFLDRLDLIEQQIQILRESIAVAMQAHQQAVLRLAAVPGFGIDSAQQVIAEVDHRLRPLTRLRSWPPGWASVPEGKNPLRYPRITGHPRAIVPCAGS